jgi:phosphoribosylanthranilate isomerase
MFIKICGITSVADARAAAGAGVHAIGLNFYPQSPRYVSADTAREIVVALPPFVDAVGVFVIAGDAAEVRAVASDVGLRTVQLHGAISPDLVSDLREFALIPAFSLVDEHSSAAIVEFVARCGDAGHLPNSVLVDAHVAGKFGGSGQLASWAVARQVVERCRVPVILAGGLTPQNVRDAIRAVRPWGVDVASGVEVAPGRKEPYKMRKFVEQAARAFAAG